MNKNNVHVIPAWLNSIMKYRQLDIKSLSSRMYDILSDDEVEMYMKCNQIARGDFITHGGTLTLDEICSIYGNDSVDRDLPGIESTEWVAQDNNEYCLVVYLSTLCENKVSPENMCLQDQTIQKVLFDQLGAVMYGKYMTSGKV